MFWHNRWSGAVLHVANRMKRSNLQKRDKTYPVLGCVGERISFTLSPSYAPSLKNLGKSLYPTVLEFWILTRRVKLPLCLHIQHVMKYIGTAFVEESRQKMQRSEKMHSFAKGASIGKSVFRMQRINTVRGRCSSSGILHVIPSNFTRSVRRRIVL